MVSILLVGLGEALISGSLEAILYDSHKQEGKEDQFRASLSHSGFWFQIGLAIGTFSGGFLYQVWHGLPFLLYGLTALISTGASFFLLEPAIDSETFTIKGYFRQIVAGTKHAFSGDLARTVSLFYILVGGVTWANQLYFNSFMLIELGFSDVTRGIIGAVFRIVNIFILGALLRNEKIFTRSRSVLFFPIMMMLCFLPGITFQGVFALPFVAGALMTGTARWIVLAKYTNEMFDSRYRATAISALSMFIGIIVTGITLFSGPIIEHFGVRMMYTILGVLGAVLVLPLGWHLRAKLKTNERKT